MKIGENVRNIKEVGDLRRSMEDGHSTVANPYCELLGKIVLSYPAISGKNMHDEAEDETMQKGSSSSRMQPSIT